MALIHVVISGLGATGRLTTHALLLSLGALAVASVFLARRVSGATQSRDSGVSKGPELLLVLLPILLAFFAARLIPVWQWDSIGYHLPFVNFAIQGRSLDAVPPDLRYISTYPHNIELGMIALRLLIPDDRLVDVAQIPYGAAGAALTCAICATLAGSSVSNSTRFRFGAFAGASWLAMPCVFLQLPTNYVDVGTAAALLGAVFFLLLTPISFMSLVFGSISLGIFIGSKPSAPLAAAVLATVAAWRAFRAHQLKTFLATSALAMVFGGEMYLSMLIRHGNPVWPVEVKLGPWTLPGTHRVDELLAAGAALPKASGSLLQRLWQSWTTLRTPMAFDMKLGGLGLAFLLAAPIAVFALMRRRNVIVCVAVGVGFVTIDPSWSRYVLGGAAVVVALAWAELSHLQWSRWWMTAAASTLVCFELTRAWQGLGGDGRSVDAYLSLSDEERRVEVGPHGKPLAYRRLWSQIHATQSIAFDEDFEFPGLLWDPQHRYTVHALPRMNTTADLEAWCQAHRVTALAVGPHHRQLLQAGWNKAFDCRSAECAVFMRTTQAVALSTLAPSSLARAEHENVTLPP
jgi:hypothetical protein